MPCPSDLSKNTKTKEEKRKECQKKKYDLADMGLEPMTFALLARRSADWANRPQLPQLCFFHILKINSFRKQENNSVLFSIVAELNQTEGQSLRPEI